MRVPTPPLGIGLVLGLTVTAEGQSAHLTALEGSVPAPVVEPMAGRCTAGLAGLWSDPTACPTTSGAFFAFFEASYSAVRLYHGAVALKWGPRWALTYGSTEIRNLFDTSLTNQDPTLGSLRAQAVWAGLDMTIRKGRVTANTGLAVAGDENVGDRQTSTVARAHLRVAPFGGDWLTIGLQASGPLGGSIAGTRSGRQRLDATVRRQGKVVSASLTGAVSRGGLWRYSETRDGVGLAAGVDVLSLASLAVGAGRYATAYGTRRYEWYRSVGASLVVRRIRVSFRYTSTRLGLGSGFGVSLGYEAEQ